jgi:RTX calcium-binding nonapeptide repeat (4 copies)
MKLRTMKTLAALALLAAAGAVVPAAASARPGVTASVSTTHSRGAAASSSVNVLTLHDFRRIDNRISAFTGPTGRLTLTAPEGLGDPDGGGVACMLDNAKPGAAMSPEVSCAPGYIGAIVGDLGGGSDTFDADPALPVMIGSAADDRPMAGGPGHDRLVGGALLDMLDGGGGPDSIAGGGGQDLLIGGSGTDNLSGGGAGDGLLGGGGSDKLSGGGGRDLCRGAGGVDVAKACELVRSVP